MPTFTIRANAKTRAPMVLIPPGEYPFELGSGAVYRLAAPLWVDVFPVRLRDVGRFVADAGYFEPTFWQSDECTSLRDQQHPNAFSDDNLPCADNLLRDIGYDEDTASRPADRLSWFEAAAYCTWVGGRLPSRLEWSIAAWGPQRLSGEDLERVGLEIENGSLRWLAVSHGEYIASERGCVGMGALRREWCWDVEGSRRIARGNPDVTPGTPDSVLRDYRTYDVSERRPRGKVGFRCVYPRIPGGLA